MCDLFSHSFFCISSSGDYNDSLNDAKVARELQPSLVQAIVRGKVSEKKNTHFIEKVVD